MQYTPSDCFVTFPFPPNSSSLDPVGDIYHAHRSNLMLGKAEGLTKTYNRFHSPEEASPDILKLRELHAAMDRAVLDAYGWTDIPTDCEFLLDYEEEDESDDAEQRLETGRRQTKKPWRLRWPDEFRDEVLARLLELNEKRHREEQLAGKLAEKEKPKVKPKSERNSTQESFLEDD